MFRAYASYFVSYLLMNIKDASLINKVILFGSASKGEASKDSDIDIFIDLEKDTKKLHMLIEKILEDFYKSREALLFKAKGADNKINLIIGRLHEWKNINKSIESEGIMLYGRYTPTGRSGKKYAVIFWDKIEKNRGAFLNKIYGFKARDKVYKGLVENFKGMRLGKSSIMVPIEHRQEILGLIKKYKANAKIIDVYK